MKSENIDGLATKGGLSDPAEVKHELEGIKSKLDAAEAALANTPQKAEIETLKASIDALKSTVAGLPTADYSGALKAQDQLVSLLALRSTAKAATATPAPPKPQGPPLESTRDGEQPRPLGDLLSLVRGEE